ncbi:glutaredoxin family protein [Listeria monocytogenes]|uniref:glutaredoxin family protein n=1 Tax=Listeria monocytogenes TaxID=1639 RepID=UPI00087449A6|nr:glutaredoxin family protein [Listeria monocytogenes]EAC5807558.1 glutaredoxin family protein [Listeria monocytogenes]EAC8099446.1 glutaredoxin family protein [Listeria monocytogenes]EAD0590331.1 glutaredoxin family protein [Listeria monocytogenes]EAE1306547.1 glutaredoxin family protein [Listeria monocytogenes]EAF6527168.1 glutaredoxin family protein [Listeria monocytogenes]
MANVVVWSKVGCHYCKDVKDYLTEQKIVFKDIDVTDHDYLREVLQAKYGIRHVPVVEIGDIEKGIYQAVTEIGIEHLEKALFEKEEVK